MLTRVPMLSTVRRVLRQEGVVQGTQLLVRKYYRKLRGRQLPNTAEANRELWSLHDWSAHGEEWTPSDEWKEAIVRHLLEPNIPIGSRVLEIGPGGGRWTEHLLPRASTLTLVDVTPACITACRSRFGDDPRIRYHVNDGRDLSFIPAGTIDRVWSYDVFVHIQASDIEGYVRQLATLMAPGGVAVIHHASKAAEPGAWRSDMTAAAMREICERCGFAVLAQLDSLDGGRVPIHYVPGSTPSDTVTVFAKR